MKKRILALVLAIVLTASLLPTVVLAAEPELTTVEVRTADELNTAINGTADIIKLMKDIDINDDLNIRSRTVTLDLNGYMLKRTSGSDLFTIGTPSTHDYPTTGDLTLTDSRAKNSTAAHKFDTSKMPWELVENTATGENIETVYGGVIMSPNGSAIVVDGGAFTMQSGSIVGCKKAGQGGVVISDGASFTMNGGQILGCYVEPYRAFAQGGGVRVNNGGTFTMTGGVIRDCKADCQGGFNAVAQGGVFVGGTFKMTGGVIRGCKVAARGGEYGTAAQGGGVCVAGTFTMTGGVIRDCAADNNDGGDGVCIGGFETDTFPNAKLNADGGAVRDNVKLQSGTLTQSANATSATVFYGELSKNAGTTNGNLVKFMVGEKQYAWEVVVDDKKAVAPDEPQPEEG